MEQQIQDARAIFEAAVRGAQAPRLLERTDWSTWTRQPFSEYNRVVVAGLGKASMAMAGVLEKQLGYHLAEGLAVVPEGYAETLPSEIPPPERIRIAEAGHPMPDGSSRRAAERLLALADSCEEDDLLLVPISGGGTALTFAPVDGVLMSEAQRAIRLLMEAGVDIQAMNAVRKHLARLGGGQLARAVPPAEGLALVVSDVVGDAFSVIASGPTVPDPDTFADAVEVLRSQGVWEKTPDTVRHHLERGAQDASRETPKPGGPAFERVRTELIGSNRDALEAAQDEAEQRGYAAHIAGHELTGEAREVGRQLVDEARAAADEAGPVCLLWGGETTVTVRGDGMGGRNQELALAAALELDGQKHDVVLLSGGTDGIDGPTDAAGAWATPHTVAQARRQEVDPAAHLENNDSYRFFEQAGGLLRTGPTHTNVMDVQVALVGEVEA